MMINPYSNNCGTGTALYIINNGSWASRVHVCVAPALAFKQLYTQSPTNYSPEVLNAVDDSEILRSQPNGYVNPVNKGISYQPQLVQDFLNHQ